MLVYANRGWNSKKDRNLGSKGFIINHLYTNPMRQESGKGMEVSRSTAFITGKIGECNNVVAMSIYAASKGPYFVCLPQNL